MNTFYGKATLAAALASACASAWALDAATIKLSDSIGFTPTLKLSESYDDNFRALETREESSWVSGIAPTLTLGAKGGKASASISYTANHEIYHSSHSDDNTDHIFNAEAGLQFDARNRLRLNAGYRDMEETASADQKIENDKYTLSTVGALYTSGPSHSNDMNFLKTLEKVVHVQQVMQPSCGPSRKRVYSRLLGDGNAWSGSQSDGATQ